MDINIANKQEYEKQEYEKQETNKQKKGLKRNTIDKYYTKNEVVRDCLELFKKHIQIFENDLIIETSAGNGSFIKGIKLISNNCFPVLFPVVTSISSIML